MARVFLPSQWRHGDQPMVLETSAGTVRGVVADVLDQRPDLVDILGGAGGPSPRVAISVDGSMASRAATPVRPDSEVHFLPAIGAG